MNNENPNLEPIQNNGIVPETNSMPVDSAPVMETVDPTSIVNTVDPTANSPMVNNDNTEILGDTQSMPAVGEPITPTVAEPAPAADTTAPQTRYNPVTGEEVTIDELLGRTPSTSVPNLTPEKKPEVEKKEVEYKPTSKGNTVMLIIFFIFLIGFIVFLPDLQNLIALHNAKPEVVEEITTGRLVCTIESNTVNLDREITRVFEYTDKKLQSAKFTTIVKGDPSLDEEALNELNDNCVMIKESSKDIEGYNISCSYEEGKLTEKESFEYGVFDSEKLNAAYAEAGGSLSEFEKDEDIDLVMTNMRQSGFSCNKEK